MHARFIINMLKKTHSSRLVGNCLVWYLIHFPLCGRLPGAALFKFNKLEIVVTKLYQNQREYVVVILTFN